VQTNKKIKNKNKKKKRRNVPAAGFARCAPKSIFNTEADKIQNIANDLELYPPVKLGARVETRADILNGQRSWMVRKHSFFVFHFPPPHSKKLVLEGDAHHR
jgi:hypothetical protein